VALRIMDDFNTEDDQEEDLQDVFTLAQNRLDQLTKNEDVMDQIEGLINRD